MTNDNRSSEEIEREIENERAGLANTLDDLQDRFSVEGIARQFGDQFREHGGDFGRSVTEAVKRNPMALALTGVGLAWMMFGDRAPSRSARRYEADDRYLPHDRSRAYDRAGRDWSDDRAAHTANSGIGSRKMGPQPGDPSKPYYSGRRQASEPPAWARGTFYPEHDDYGHDENENQDNGPSMTDKARSAASGAAQSASNTASSVAGSVKSAGSSVAGGVASGARSARDRAASTGASVAGGVKNAAASASDQASAMRARLAEGTEQLSQEARERVIVARQSAIEAWEAAGGYAQQGRDRAVDLYDEHPLIAGALAVAVGAALGAALPRSRTEDAYLGERRDALFHEAERIYEEEKSKLSKVAKAATDEAKDIVRETKEEADDKAPADTAAKAAADKAKDSGKRIADAAKSEAKKQNVGEVSS